MKNNRIFALTALLLAACQIGDGFEDYYGGGGGPTIGGLDVTSENGTIGGGTLRISGSNFGDDPAAITVVFGSQNAVVVSADGSSVEIIVPRGPIEGGAVDIVVGTERGQSRLKGGYFYDADGPDVEGFYDGQIGYVAVTNDTLSCMGGIGHPSEAWFCQNSPMTGVAGVEGKSELLKFLFPRVGAPYTGYRGGWGGTTDFAWNEWKFLAPPQDINTFDLEDLYSNLRHEVKNFKLRNPALQGTDWCSDLSGIAQYPVNGGVWNTVDAEGNTVEEEFEGFDLAGPVTSLLTNAQDQDGNCLPGAKRYDLGEMNFCQSADYNEPRSYQYEAEWPVGGTFFGTKDEAGEIVTDQPVEVVLDMPDAGVEGVSIRLPEYATFYGTSGFALDYLTLLGVSETNPSYSNLFSIVGFSPDCIDSNGDHSTTGDDVAAVWEWVPSTAELSTGGSIHAARSFVRVGATYVRLGWFGGAGATVKAVITVPDAYNVDPETGRSRLEMPASILYQFPSANFDIGYRFDPASGYVPGDWGDPARTDYGFIMMTAERITEYKIGTSLGGDVVFSYSTGDIGYLGLPLADSGYASWVNKVQDGENCGDCDDQDGDGWVDALDPDCLDEDAPVEDNHTFGDASCNDGEDNDGDGKIDADDPKCTSGGEAEGTCRDGEDNDGDGWADNKDPDCADGELEDNSTFGDTPCNDGVDNEGDGFADADDPECRRGDEFEGNCADGEDNDGDGWVDELDGECADPWSGDEVGVEDPGWGCSDGIDEDADGWADTSDPDCLTGADSELGFGTDECNDGVDNDGHGDIDAADLACFVDGATATEVPDGLRNDCIDGADNDGDLFVDAKDPGCEVNGYGNEAKDLPAGFPIPACYDGEDNDGDTLIDALDPDCLDVDGQPDGFITSEGVAP